MTLAQGGRGVDREVRFRKEWIMNITSLIIQMIAGAIGGNVAGAAIRTWSLGVLGNSLAGIVGGGVGGQILASVLGARGIGDPSSILANVAGGGVGGVILMMLAGLVRWRMVKARS
jgi:uncharacterized membrane protein YeaQ/YmgE (transglycosylase-associated protein family)